MRRVVMVYWLLGALFLTCLGCAAVDRSIQDYKACKGDQQCLKDMTDVKDTSYIVAKGVTSSFPLPSIPEAIAIVVSNVAAFVFGATQGHKFKKS
ncbi:MAG: hypothetical protein [Microviridae sp.]|nr:MAG: hypothetical protein [Microviridae sp.]